MAKMDLKFEKTEDIIEHSSAEAASLVGRPPWLVDRLEWFQDQKLGLLLHWSPAAQWDCPQSWGLVPGEQSWALTDKMKSWTERDRDFDRFTRDYRALNTTFNPLKFDPGLWAETSRAAGMRYMGFTSKHHDGFCMWDTTTTDYRITHSDCPFSSHPKADILKHVFDAFRNQGLAISCYFSKSDWHVPTYWNPDFEVKDRHPNYDTKANPEQWQRFVTFVHNQVRELMSDYGPIDMLWLDGGQVRPPDQDIDMATIAAMARELQPGLIIADRTVGGEYEDFITPEQKVPDAPLGVPWESCITLADGWKYRPGFTYKPARQVITLLADVVAKGGNLLLGIGPTPEGAFEDTCLVRLKEIGAWLDVNGEAIYGTRAIAPYVEGNIRYTQKDGMVYAIACAEQGQDDPSEIRLPTLTPAPGSDVRLLGHDRPLAWRQDGDTALVTLPERLPCQWAWVVTFQQHRI